MKQKLLFSLFVLLLLPLVANAYDAKIDGIYYNFSGDEAVVTYQSSQKEVLDDGTEQVTYISDYTGDVVIPASVTFEDKTYSVTSIGESAFRDCKFVTSVTIPETVVSIGRSALRKSGIRTIDIPESVKSIGVAAFYGCTSLKSVTVPKSVEKLEEATFDYCSGLTSVTLQEGLTFIDEWVFAECLNLTDITFPKSLTHIAGAAFLHCPKLATISLPENLKTIGQYAFYDCTGLTSLDIPDNLDSLGQVSFCYCSALTSLKLPKKLKTIWNDTFWGCSSLTSLDIPSNITTIGDKAFVMCTGLKSLRIPETVSQIGTFAFGLCTGLTSITVDEGNKVYDSRDNCNAIIETANNNLILGCSITEFPNTLKSIYIGAFYGLTDMTSLTIPEGVESLYDGAFEECSGLTSVTLPSTVKFIDIYVFCNCTGLKDFYCNAVDIPETFETTFNGVPLASATLHVPAASLEKYKSTYPWSSFGSIVAQVPTSVNGIGNDASANIPVCYDLNGRRIDRLSTVNSEQRKGIFIQNGRKFIGK